jgi:hypothetical protein
MVQLYGLRQNPLKSLANGFICGLKKNRGKMKKSGKKLVGFKNNSYLCSVLRNKRNKIVNQPFKILAL